MRVSTDTWRTRCPRKSDRVHLVTDDHCRHTLEGPGSGSPLFLDAFGAELWERLDGENDLDSIVSGLSRSFGFPPTEATDHVRIWVDTLFDHGLVDEPDDEPLATADGEFGTT